MITIENLTKKYGGTTVVHDINFTASTGRVTGFLGPNGAGKSTSMRMLVGLTTPTEGTATINGRHFADLPNPGREVGVMLDASAQHAGRTGREILTIAQQIMDVPASRVAELLELVSLTGAEADRRVGNYSLGMRQRLGIAAALIGDPAGADPGRACQRARPGRHPLDARPAPRLRRRRRDRPAVLAPAGRDRDHRRRHRDDRAGPDRLPGLQVRPAAGRRDRRPRRGHRSPAARAGRAGVTATVSEDGSLRTEADTALVGRAAYDGGVVLTELRTADSGGLEEMFLELTADTQRDTTSERSAA